MPGQAPAATDERELLAGYIGQQQDGFRNALHGLTDEEAGRAPVASTTLTVGTLAKHVTQVQQHWLDLVRRAAGEHVAAEDPEAVGAAWQSAWTWSATDTVASVLAGFDATGAAVLDGVRRLDLDTAVPVPPAPWNPRDVEAWSARWVWLHLVEELGSVVPPPPGVQVGAGQDVFDAWEAFLAEAGVPTEPRDAASAIEDPDGVGPRYFFQRVPEDKTAKNRVHLDVRAAPGLQGEERMAALEVEAARLVGLGARRVGRHEPTPPLGAGHLVMADPEGNEFCLD